MTALELADNFRKEVDQYVTDLDAFKSKLGPKPDEIPVPSPHFLGRTIYDHILIQLKLIRSSDLENSMRFLNQPQSFSLLFYIEHMLRNVSFPQYISFFSIGN
jgi:hypothetical protein